MQPLNSWLWTVKGLSEAITAAGKSFEEVAAESGIPAHTLRRLAAGEERAHVTTFATLRRVLGETAGESNLKRGW